MSLLLGLLPVMVLGLAVAFATVVSLIAHRLRRPPRRTYAWALARGVPGDPSELHPARPFTDTTFPAARRHLPLWDIPGDNPTGPVVILSPGWGDARVGALARLQPLLPRAAAVLAWDPPGLGDAPGPWLMGAREHHDLLALVHHARLTHPGRPVVLFGWSAGAGISIAAAAAQHDAADAVIAEAPYRLPRTPAVNVLRLAGLPHGFAAKAAFLYLGARVGAGPRWVGFDRAHLAARLRCPLLVLHGDADAVCPIADGHDIAHAAGAVGSLAVVHGAGHNDLWTDPRFRQTSADAVLGFLDRAITR